MLSFKHFMLGLFFILSIALSTWSIFLSNKKPIIKASNSEEADAYMENVHAVIINEKGAPELIIEAPYLIHFPDNSTDITHPHITVFRQSPEPWYINADFAKTLDGINQIDFWNNVTIYHKKDISTETTTMLTHSLTVFPHQQIATTKDPVFIMQPNIKVHAIGMWANLKEGVVKLLTETQGEYAPTS